MLESFLSIREGRYVLNEHPGDTDCCLGLLPNAEYRDISDLNGGGEFLDSAQTVTESGSVGNQKKSLILI